MPLFYNKVQRVNPRDPKGAHKWYPILKSVGQVDEHEVAKLVSDETTLNPKEAEMAVYQLEKVMERLLLDGHTVQLGELGSFSLHRRGLPRRERGDARQNQKGQPAFPCRQRHQGRFGRSQVPSCRGFVEQEKVARKIPSARSFKIMLMISKNHEHNFYPKMSMIFRNHAHFF